MSSCFHYLRMSHYIYIGRRSTDAAIMTEVQKKKEKSKWLLIKITTDRDI